MDTESNGQPNVNKGDMGPDAKPVVTMDDLPNEVLTRILDHVPPLNYIVRMSHLSRRWRSVAHAHPTFCRYIQFMFMEDEAAPSPARGALFVKQLTSSDQPIHLTVMLLKSTPQVVSTLLPLLSEHLHRVVSLCLSLHFNYSPELVFATLNRPAPLLKWLRLDLQGHPSLFAFTRRVLPRTIFSGQSALKTLILSDVSFPDGPVSGIESVERVALCALPDMSQIQRAMQLCPRMRRLDLVVTSGTTEEASKYLCTPAVAQLQHIWLRTAPHIIHYYEQLLADFVGPLRVTELFTTYFGVYQGEEIPSTFDLTIVDKDSGRERRFGSNSVNDLEAVSQRVANLGLADRIVEFTVTLNTLDVASEIFPVMKNLEVFIVELKHLSSNEMLYPPIVPDYTYTADDEWIGFAWLTCPAVTKVVIVGDGQTCTTQWLANFMGYTLGATCRRRIELELKGTTLVGDPQEIWGYFKSIIMLPA